MNTAIQSVDQYIDLYPPEVCTILKKIRSIIKETAPQAGESISYGMPAYKAFGKPLVYFGAFRNHIGFYATPSGHRAFQERLSAYKQGKGSVQFPLHQPMPYELIRDMTTCKLKEIETGQKTAK